MARARRNSEPRNRGEPKWPLVNGNQYSYFPDPYWLERQPESYPSCEQLRRGAVLSTIAEAIWQCEGPGFQDQRWNGLHYAVDDGQGTIGQVSFAEEGVIGAFFDVPYFRERRDSPEEVTLSNFGSGVLFDGMPPAQRRMAGLPGFPVQQMLSAYGGIITAVFWSVGDRVSAAEPWPVVFQHGAHLLRRQLMDTEPAIAAHAENMALSDLQVELLADLYDRWLADESNAFVTAEEQDAMVEAVQTEIARRVRQDTLYPQHGNAAGRMAADAEPHDLDERERATAAEISGRGLSKCREMLASIGFALP